MKTGRSDEGRVTRHAKARRQQRCIHPLARDLVLEYGSSVRSRGATQYFFDNASRKRLRRSIGRPMYEALKGFLNIFVIVSDDGFEITSGHRTQRIRER